MVAEHQLIGGSDGIVSLVHLLTICSREMETTVQLLCIMELVPVLAVTGKLDP